jgi:hypothetical protein
MHTAPGWTALEDVAPEAAAAWIRSVAPDGDGFAVDYRRDAGWLLVDVAPTDGDYRRIVRTDGRVGPPHPVPAPVARRKS